MLAKGGTDGTSLSLRLIESVKAKINILARFLAKVNIIVSFSLLPYATFQLAQWANLLFWQ